jgi:lipopolysaccharide export system protein LptA
MKRSEAARYARWSAALALLLAAVTVGVYLRHGIVASVQRRKAPPAPATDVERQSAGLAFSKVEGDRKIFTVEASKSTEFRNQDASLLEEVKITIFGKQSDRHDVIRTQSCRYTKLNGSITCAGLVQMDLQSAAAAEAAKQTGLADRIPAAGHIETRNVTFEQASGTARTGERVTFAFPAGAGEALGVEYNSQQGTLNLLHDVKMNLVQTGGPKGTANQQVRVTGASLDFSRDTRVLHLLGPAHAQTQTAQLDAGEIALNLDDDYHVQKMFAIAGTRGEKPRASSAGAPGTMNIAANMLTAWFDADGGMKKLDASGNVEGFRKTGAEDDQFTAEVASVDLWPELTQPKQVNLNGKVVLQTAARDGQSRKLETEKVRMDFSRGDDDHPSRPKHAETLAAGTVEWLEASAGKAGSGRTRLQADKLALDFSAGRASQLTATGNVRTERAIAGGASQSASAGRGVVQLLAGGGWSQINLDGNVQLRDRDRNAQADQAVAERASQAMTLTGRATVRDATTETRAGTIEFSQLTGDIHAGGGVRSTTFSAKGATPQLAAVPANITADQLQANAQNSRALYSGHARLWQGDSVLESDSIELFQKTRELHAVGDVRAVFPQAAGREPAITTVSVKPGKKSNLWHLAAKSLNYLDAENRAHLEGNVVVQSEVQRMRSGLLDLYFTRGKPGGAPETGQNMPSGAQQIDRAVGTGGVIVEEQTRKATAERAEYTAIDGKFVMSGGNPTLFDGSQGTTKGRQLTFFLADDTIIVDSENGSRILTKHRVEK